MSDEVAELSLDDIRPHCAGFTLEKKIGVGGQKEVFRATDSTGKRLVVKLVRIEYFWFGTQSIMRDSDTESRTLREVELMKAYASPHLPSLYNETVEYITINGYTYLMFKEEYAGSESLHDMLVANGVVTEAMVINMLSNVSSALSLYSQDGIVHRDVKPQNIVYNEETDTFVLIDGGVHLSPNNPTLSKGFIAGTEPYYSPEQAQGKRRELDSRSDMFSLGITAYQALTGMHPFAVTASTKEQFEINRANSTYPTLPQGVYKTKTVEVVTRLLEKYPHNRYRNPDALLLEFKEEEE